MAIKITDELKNFIAESTLEKVYFTKDGHFHLSAHKIGDKLYAPGANAIYSAANPVFANNAKYEIVAVLTREEILKEEQEEMAQESETGIEEQTPPVGTEQQSEPENTNTSEQAPEQENQNTETKTGTEEPGQSAEPESDGQPTE